jgi:hypothetical protein
MEELRNEIGEIKQLLIKLMNKSQIKLMNKDELNYEYICDKLNRKCLSHKYPVYDYEIHNGQEGPFKSTWKEDSLEDYIKDESSIRYSSCYKYDGRWFLCDKCKNLLEKYNNIYKQIDE